MKQKLKNFYAQESILNTWFFRYMKSLYVQLLMSLLLEIRHSSRAFYFYNVFVANFTMFNSIVSWIFLLIQDDVVIEINCISFKGEIGEINEPFISISVLWILIFEIDGNRTSNRKKWMLLKPNRWSHVLLLILSVDHYRLTAKT